MVICVSGFVVLLTYALVDNKKFLPQLCKVTTYFGDGLRDLKSMALLGKIEQYDPEQEEWPQYVERLEQYYSSRLTISLGMRKPLSG